MTTTTDPATEFVNFLQSDDRPTVEEVLETRRTVATDGVLRNAFLEELLEREKQADRDGMAPDDRLKIGTGYWVLGDQERALEVLGRSLSTPVAFYITGRAFLESKDYESAIDRFDKALAKESDSFTFQVLLAEAYRKSGDVEKARKLLDKLEKKNSKQPGLHYEMGVLHEHDGLHEEAIVKYEAAVELDSKHGKSLFRLASNYEMLGEEEMAVEYYERVRNLQPTFVNALINLGILYEDLGQYGKASDCYREVLQVNPSNARARMYLKDAKASQNMYYDEDQLRDRDKYEQVLQTPVTDFELSVRSRNCLEKMGLRTLGDLISQDESELLAYKNFGETSLLEIKELLNARGLKLGQGKEESKEASAQRLGTLLRDMSDQLLEEPISKLELSLRSERAMESLELRTIGELVAKTEAELMNVKNFGGTSLDEIREALAKRGLTLRIV